MTDIDTTRLRELHALADKGRPGWAEGNDFLCRIMPKIPALLDASDERDTLRIDRDAYRASADQARIERDRLKAENERLLAALDAIEQLHRAALEGEP